MSNANTLSITPSGDRDLVIRRTFDAPATALFDALTQPDSVRRWLLGPPGWTMPVCQIDLCPGGAYRYVWRSEKDGTEMGMGGVYCEVDRPRRLVATEKFDQPWYPGEAVGAFEVVELDGNTMLTQTIRYDSHQARDAVLDSGMADGVAASYDRLELLLARRD